MTIRRGRHLVVLIMLTGSSILSSAQSQFAGHWQSKSGRTGKPAFTVNIDLAQDTIKGTMILVDPSNGREIESEITNAESHGTILEFTTKVHNDTFEWRLTLKDKRHGLLHGSTGEMLIDEQVVKRQT